MSIYYVHKIAQQVAKDPEFRERMKRDPEKAKEHRRLAGPGD